MKEIARSIEIPPGNAGILMTLSRMRDRVRENLGSPWVRWAYREAVHTVPPECRTNREVLIAAIYEWVLQHLIYTQDGAASDSVLHLEEEIRSPDYLFNRIYQTGTAEGDCDDFVIALAALLLTGEIPAAWTVTSARVDREFDHVFTEALTSTQWIVLDGIHGAPMGWHVPLENVTNMHTELV